MDKLIFLDTETTGNDLFNDRLVEICFQSNTTGLVCERFHPPVPITVKAQSIHHITNKMVVGLKEFKHSKLWQDLNKILQDNILVAHNAAFDINVLQKEEVKTGKFICTLKVARFLDVAGDIAEYNLQFLRYFWELEVLDAYAHDAKSDVLVLEAVFTKLYQLMTKQLGAEDHVIEKMVEISGLPFLIRSFNFGKYKDRRVDEIARLDRGYLAWLLEQKEASNNNEEDWVYTLKHYLHKQ